MSGRRNDRTKENDMAGSPQYKVFDAAGAYQAACKEAAASAVVASFYGPGATVRNGHAKRDTVWTQGPEADGDVADVSYDDIEALVHDRIERNRERRDRDQEEKHRKRVSWRFHSFVPAEALKATVSTLNAQADAALASGDTDTYHQRVDEMIEAQDRYIDKHGNLPGRQP
jgi:hypothetical protein